MISTPTRLLLLLTAASCVECIELVQPAAMAVKPGQSFSIACVECIELVQPAAMAVKPGQSFSIACKISGYTAIGGGYTNWIRHSAGKAPEWIGYFYSSSATTTTDSLKSKISFTADSSSNAVLLQGQNFQPEDTAVYYCARDARCYKLPRDLYNNPLTLELKASSQTAVILCGQNV
ncbi:hypothetical protein MHYP_G00145530 [Metynnis hypsauchen]